MLILQFKLKDNQLYLYNIKYSVLINTVRYHNNIYYILYISYKYIFIKKNRLYKSIPDQIKEIPVSLLFPRYWLLLYRVCYRENFNCLYKKILFFVFKNKIRKKKK